jgi:hypothetical protein
MMSTWPGVDLDAEEMTSRTPYQQRLLARLHHQIEVAAPAAAHPWQHALLAHVLRRTLDECSAAGLATEATAALRRRGAGQRPAAIEEPASPA